MVPSAKWDQRPRSGSSRIYKRLAWHSLDTRVAEISSVVPEFDSLRHSYRIQHASSSFRWKLRACRKRDIAWRSCRLHYCAVEFSTRGLIEFRNSYIWIGIGKCDGLYEYLPTVGLTYNIPAIFIWKSDAIYFHWKQSLFYVTIATFHPYFRENILPGVYQIFESNVNLQIFREA